MRRKPYYHWRSKKRYLKYPSKRKCDAVSLARWLLMSDSILITSNQSIEHFSGESIFTCGAEHYTHISLYAVHRKNCEISEKICQQICLNLPIIYFFYFDLPTSCIQQVLRYKNSDLFIISSQTGAVKLSFNLLYDN